MNELITLHPKVVHFPVALIYVSAFFEILFFVSKKEFFGKTSVWLFYLGLLSAAAAATTGLIAENTLGHVLPNHDKIHDHRNWMLATIGLWTLVASAGYFTRKTKIFRKYFIVCILPIMAILTVGVDKGGKLVYKYGVGVNKKILKEQPKAAHEHTDGQNHEQSHD